MAKIKLDNGIEKDSNWKSLLVQVLTEVQLVNQRLGSHAKEFRDDIGELKQNVVKVSDKVDGVIKSQLNDKVELVQLIADKDKALSLDVEKKNTAVWVRLAETTGISGVMSAIGLFVSHYLNKGHQ